MKQGDIVLVYFPFTHFRNGKHRPALIISNTSYGPSSDFLLLAISSQIGSGYDAVPLLPDHLLEGQLKKLSYIRATSILKIDHSLLIKKIGRVHPFTTIKAVQRLYRFLRVE